jgi:hypothetical protein
MPASPGRGVAGGGMFVKIVPQRPAMIISRKRMHRIRGNDCGPCAGPYFF